MPYQIRQEKFEGPLDLLLDLIQKEQLSVNEISLAQVTDDFVKYLRGLKEQGAASQEMLAEFLVVAAQLLLIKSRSLLPEFQTSPEEEASLQELEQRLITYQRMKELAGILGAMAAGGRKSFSREAYTGEKIIFYPPRNFQPAMLASAWQSLLLVIPKAERIIEEKLKRVVSLEEKIRELQSLLRMKVERLFSDVVSGAKEKVDVIVSFLAMLELTKQRLVSVEQKGLFGDITIKKTDPNHAG